jgi:chemotaxis protein methyltransferase WspC
MKQIEQRLQEIFGLDGASLGPGGIAQAVLLRMKALDSATPEDYWRVLQATPSEWTELVEAVVVPETWFFRDAAAFAAVASLVSTEWLPAHPAGVARLLSLPCSSGEEPYSLAMALLDAGVPLVRFRIDAVDISARALAVARKGLYGKNSFRGRQLAFRDRHFRATRQGFSLNPGLRNSVTFSQGNLFAGDFLADKGSYDFIFCRNLLIYCSRSAQEQAFARLTRLLAPGGVLFLGPAEHPLALAHGFITADLPLAFGCRKLTHATARAAGRLEMPTCAAEVADTPRPQSSTFNFQPATNQTPPEKHPDLHRARLLADSGRLAEAAALCEAHLRRCRDSANGYYLLGLLRDAGGDSRAIDCYRKALYLEPNHHEALLQMALLADKNGDTAAARAFKRRAQRIPSNDVK